MVEVGFGLIQSALFDLHTRFRLMKGRRRLVQVRLRGIFLREQFLGALGVEPGQLQGRSRVGHIAFGLGHRGLKKGRIDLGYHLPGLDLRIKIDEQLRDVAGDLTADLHVYNRI